MLKTKKRNFYSSKYNNFFIVYELDTWSRELNSHFTLKDCLFRGFKLAKSTDPDKYDPDILVMVLDSIHVQNLHYVTAAWVKMALFSELI